MEFLINKTNECPRCKCENLKKYDDKAKCENCHAKFELFTTESSENDTK